VNVNFCAESDTVLVVLSDEELALKLDDIAKIKAPGKDYFLEVSVIDGVEFKTLDNKIERIIYYSENDT